MRRAQGEWRPKARRPPLDELVLTILSQNTTDANSGRAFRSLRERFPAWEEVMVAPVDEVADAIRSGGIANIKARRIQAILAAIDGREGSLDLSSLRRRSDDEARAYLISLPGVGRKTAACVLLFSLRRPAFPVDTHIHRVARRLGLVAENASADATHAALEPLVPPELRYEFHVQLIRHGREICRPRSPRCTACILLDLCDAGPRFLADSSAR